MSYTVTTRNHFKRNVRNKLTNTDCIINLTEMSDGRKFLIVYMEEKTYMYYKSIENLSEAVKYINAIEPLTEYERYNYISYNCSISGQARYEEFLNFIKELPEEVEDIANIFDNFIYNMNVQIHRLGQYASNPIRSYPLSLFHIVENEKVKVRNHLDKYFENIPKEHHWWITNPIAQYLYELTTKTPDNGGVEPQKLSWLKCLEDHATTIEELWLLGKKAEEEYWKKQPS